MVGQHYMSQEYKAYLKSEVWKCDESPTGAHHWVEVEKYATRSLFVCRYCLDPKEFPTIWSRPT